MSHRQVVCTLDEHCQATLDRTILTPGASLPTIGAATAGTTSAPSTSSSTATPTTTSCALPSRPRTTGRSTGRLDPLLRYGFLHLVERVLAPPLVDLPGSGKIRGAGRCAYRLRGHRPRQHHRDRSNTNRCCPHHISLRMSSSVRDSSAPPGAVFRRRMAEERQIVSRNATDAPWRGLQARVCGLFEM